MSATNFHSWVLIPENERDGFVTVREIPTRTSEAVYPRIPERMVVTDILKQPSRDANQPLKPVPLTDDEWRVLAGIWWNLPAIKFPLSVSDWETYSAAFEHAGHQPEWCLQPLISDAAFNQALSRNATFTEHEKQLSEAVRAGRVTTLSPLTKLAENLTVQKPGKDSLVSFEQFREFAATLGIGIKAMHEFTTPARPLSVDPVLPTLKKGEEIRVSSNVGGVHSTVKMCAGEFIAEIEAVMKRQGEGFFTVAEAAQVLTDGQGMSDVRHIINQMHGAFTVGGLRIRDYQSRLPHATESEILDFLSLVTVSDIDAWLEGTGAGYRFPKLMPDQMESIPQTASNSANVVHKIIGKRRNPLTPVIELAQSKCINSKDASEVWGKLLKLAAEKSPPLLGSTEDGLQYLKNGETAYLTLDALSKRLGRQQDR